MWVWDGPRSAHWSGCACSQCSTSIPLEVVTVRESTLWLLDTVTSKQSIVWPPRREREIEGDRGRQREGDHYDLGLSERHIRAVLKSHTTSCIWHSSTTAAHSTDWHLIWWRWSGQMCLCVCVCVREGEAEGECVCTMHICCGVGGGWY